MKVANIDKSPKTTLPYFSKIKLLY